MKSYRRILAALVVVLCVSMFAFAQDRKGNDKPAAHAGEPTPEQMQAMMKAGQPGPEHAKLMAQAGVWEAKVQMFGPDGSPQGPLQNGTMTMEPMMDGRFLAMKYEGSMDMGMGPQTFKGMAISGYDNTKKKYWNIWIDSMSTGLMMTEGEWQGDKLTMTGTMTNPMDGKDCKIREVITHKGKDATMYEMHAPGMDGKEMKMMEINYTRKK